MERFKQNSILFPFYLKLFKYNWNEMANIIAKSRAKDPNGYLDLKDLDTALRKKQAK